MSQTSSLVGTQLRPVYQCDSGVVTIPAAGNTVIATMVLMGLIQNLAVEAIVAVNNIDAFIVEAQFHPNGDWVQITNAITSTPGGLILAASGTLANLAVGTGWFSMDVRGLYAVRISASGTVADTTTVRLLAGGS